MALKKSAALFVLITPSLELFGLISAFAGSFALLGGPRVMWEAIGVDLRFVLS